MADYIFSHETAFSLLFSFLFTSFVLIIMLSAFNKVDKKKKEIVPYNYNEFEEFIKNKY